MQWISRVVRGAGGQLQVKLSGGIGTESLSGLLGLPPDLGLASSEQRKATLTLQLLTRSRAREYLEALGFPDLSEAGQPVYAAAVNGQTWLIPAQLLVLSVLGNNRRMRERLMTPTPLRDIASSLRRSSYSSPALLSSLAWLADTPGGSAVWSSVYRRALEGQLDMAMPSATATFMAGGRVVEGRFLVTKLRLLSLAPSRNSAAVNLETRVNDAHPPIITMTSSVDIDPRLRGWSHTSRLTDAQWARILNVLPPERERRPGPPRVHDRRAIVELMLTKLSGHRAWADFPDDGKLVARAAGLFTGFRNSGLLDAVISIVLSAPRKGGGLL